VRWCVEGAFRTGDFCWSIQKKRPIQLTNFRSEHLDNRHKQLLLKVCKCLEAILMEELLHLMNSRRGAAARRAILNPACSVTTAFRSIYGHVENPARFLKQNLSLASSYPHPPKN
jgi:hypothetical protein